jgi:hypothetical protein
MALLHPASERLGAFLLLYALAWVACWGASRTANSLLQVLVGAILFRALLVPLEPSLSDDIYRYVWEGRIQGAGANPFRLPPTSPELAPLRDAVWERINNPDASAIYPPLAQLVFRLLAMLGGVTLFKAAFSLADVALVLLLGWSLKRRGTPVRFVALYAWNPLAVVEIAGSGHLEPLAILPLVLALVALPSRATLAWSALAASIALKYAAALCVPVVARAARPRLPALAAAAALLLVVTLPYVDAGRALFDSLLLYTEKWRFNDMLFGALDRLLPSHWWAKAATAALLGALAVLLLRRRVAVEPAVMALFAALIFVSPTVHPWYLLWPLALIPLVPWTPLFIWSGTIALAYTFLYPVAGRGPFDMGSWVPRALQMLPPLAWLAIDLRRRRGQDAGTPPRIG